MKLRNFCFIAFLLISTSLAIAEERPTPEEVQSYLPYWNANKEAFSQTHVYQCVGNEDNSLFLLNIVTNEAASGRRRKGSGVQGAERGV